MHSHRDCRQHSPQDITVLAGPVSVGAEPAHAPHVEFQSPIARWIRWAWRSSSAGGRIGSGVMKAPSMPKAVQREENLAQASAPEEPGVRLVSEQPADDPDGMPLPSDLRFPGRLVLAGTPFSILCGAGDRPAHRARLRPHACSATSLANAGAPSRAADARRPSLDQLVVRYHVAFATALSGPAASWAAKLPEGVPRLLDHLSFLRPPIEAVRQFLQHAEGYVSGDTKPTEARPRLRASEAASGRRCLRARAPSRGDSSRLSWCSYSCWFRATFSCGASSRSCPAIATSGKRSKSSSISRVISRPTWPSCRS
jgi:hypothetical protein